MDIFYLFFAKVMLSVINFALALLCIVLIVICASFTKAKRLALLNELNAMYKQLRYSKQSTDGTQIKQIILRYILTPRNVFLVGYAILKRLNYAGILLKFKKNIGFRLIYNYLVSQY